MIFCWCKIFIAYRTICPGFSWILSKYLWNMRSPWTGNDFSYFSSLSLFIETIPPVTRLHGLLGFAFCSIFLWNKMKIYIKMILFLKIIWFWLNFFCFFFFWVNFRSMSFNEFFSRIINDFREQWIAVPKRFLYRGLFWQVALLLDV